MLDETTEVPCARATCADPLFLFQDAATPQWLVDFMAVPFLAVRKAYVLAIT